MNPNPRKWNETEPGRYEATTPDGQLLWAERLEHSDETWYIGNIPQSTPKRTWLQRLLRSVHPVRYPANTTAKGTRNHEA